jgi:hypothetical protein
MSAELEGAYNPETGVITAEAKVIGMENRWEFSLAEAGFDRRGTRE